jgi:hypothetical protein
MCVCLQLAAVTHALRALRIVVLCLPEVHLAMIREVQGQLRALLPLFASAKTQAVRRTPEVPAVTCRIRATDPRGYAGETAHDHPAVLDDALQVIPRLIRSFCKSGGVSFRTAPIALSCKRATLTLTAGRRSRTGRWPCTWLLC